LEVRSLTPEPFYSDEYAQEYGVDMPGKPMYIRRINITERDCMVGKIQKWGNSLAVRIPKSVAVGANLSCGGGVKLSVQEGGIFITSIRKRKTLDDVVSGITKKNRHKAVDCGSVGREQW
jgi:antitoxin MazE